MEKNILFYSNLCQYSMDVVNEITKRDVRNDFVFVCIDTNRHKLPPFVVQVPMIVTPSKEIVTDDAIHQTINNIYMAKMETQQVDVSPYSQLDMNSKFSDNFAYIGDENSENANAEHTFAFVSQDFRINAPVEEVSGRGSKIDPAVFEQFKAQRDSEYPTQPQNGMKRI